jgi:hypothetical protein
VLALLFGPGCHGRIASPSTSFTLLSTQLKEGDPRLLGVGPEVTQSACMHWLAIPQVWWGDAASHEDLVSRALDQYDSDVLLDSDLKVSWFSVGLYWRRCSTVTGRPAKFNHIGGTP